ncbi:MAG TPA: MipA/OmpV family protein [Stellaceae bacterium]|nr:MipA/OmpV family protein [Stellaceae bacterium]
MKSARVTAVAVLLAALIQSRPAPAQTPAPLANWQYSVGDLLEPLMGPQPTWRAYVGAGLAAQPVYEGSQRYHALPAPIVDAHYKDLAFLSVGEGIGVNLLRGKLYRAGVALTYDLGRDQHAATRLKGLGTIGVAPEVKLFADVALLPVILDFDLRRAIGGTDGYIGDIGMHVPIPLASNVFLFAGPSVTFADGRYMQSYFGVSAAQTVNSEFRPFDAHGGVKRAGFGLTAVYQISEQWMLASDGAAQRLLGAAARSPIVESKVEFTIDLNAVYKF